MNRNAEISNESIVAVENLTVRWNATDPPVIHGVSFRLQAGDSIAIMGGSGVGKSTLVRAIAGLTECFTGTVQVPPDTNGQQSGCGMLFQDPWLYPWLSARDNVAWALRRLIPKRTSRRVLAIEALREVGLQGHEDKFPFQLSRGMSQRVAFARCFVAKPKLILADEPFASLDSFMKSECIELFSTLRRANGATVIVVTHDVREAVAIADRICVLAGNPASIRFESETLAAKESNAALADLTASVHQTVSGQSLEPLKCGLPRSGSIRDDWFLRQSSSK